VDRLNEKRTPHLGLLLTGEQMSPVEMAQWAATAEQAGFESVWVTEGYWDAVVPLTLMTQTTTRVRLGAACAIVGRHPYPAQLAWAGIESASRGRLVLGLADGPSGPNSSWWGGRPSDPVRRMREHLELTRLMLTTHSGRVADFHGNHYTVERFQRWVPPERDHIPILLGATQPGMLRLAGEVADGYVAAALNSPAHFHEVVRPNLELGLERSGRSIDDLEVAAVRICSVADNAARAREVARTTIAFYAGIAPRLADVLDHEGFSLERREIENAFRLGGVSAAAAFVPEAAVERLAIAGTPAQCKDQFTALGADLDTVILYPPALGLDKREMEESYHAVVETFAPHALVAAER
jgi:alkanesulfonate monooxygenase SsuD/methylene tetrahydromethanopterin reductase-like flavin-dependent oxidoreductase (luciferase family)